MMVAATASFGVVARVKIGGFAIRSHLVSKLASLSRDVNDGLMAMQLQLTNKQNATLISAYARL